MRLFLWFTLVIVTFIAIQSTVDGGLIRRSRRLRRIGPHRHHSGGGGGGGRSARVLQRRKWPHFLAPPRKWHFARNLRRPKPQSTEREDRQPSRPVHHMRLPLMMAQPSNPVASWRPLDFGNPIDRDPTFDYAPPALERVRFSEPKPAESRRRKPTIMRSENGKPRPGGQPNPMFGRPRRPSIWKLLATKQRSRRPYNRRPPPPHHPHHMRHPLNTPPHNPLAPIPVNQDSDEAEIFPRLPNIVYFRTNDVVPGSSKPFIPPQHLQHLKNVHANNMNVANRPLFLVPTYKPGQVTNVPLYSRENSSPSQFNPVVPTQSLVQPPKQSLPPQQQQQQKQQLPSSTTPQYTPIIPKQPTDILYRAQDFMNPTRKPTVLQPVKSTPVTYSATRNSVIKPSEPTESLLNIVNNNNDNDDDDDLPLNSFSILNAVNSVFGSSSTKNSKKNNYYLDDKDDREKDLSDIKKVVKTERPSPIFEPSSTTTTKTTTTKSSVPVEEESSTDYSPITISTSVSSSTSVHIRDNVPAASSSSSTTTENSATSSSSSVQRSSSTWKPPVSTTTTSPTTTTTTTPGTTTTTLSYQKLPPMPSYKSQRPSPTYPKRITSIGKNGGTSTYGSAFNANVGSSSSSSKESGEGLVIMTSRSKVKQYRPQFLANYTQLLTFDKVQEIEPSANDAENEPITSSSLIVNSASVTNSAEKVGDSPSSNTENKDSTTTTTTKSPLQQFDPMKLLHSWFQNS